MQVKFEVEGFTGIADLGGAEVEVLNRALAKMKVVRQQYLESRYVLVEQADSTIKAEMTVTPTIEVMADAVFQTKRKAQEERERQQKANEEAARAALIAQIVEAHNSGDDTAAIFTRFIELCGQQSLLYYKEADTTTLGEVTDEAIEVHTVSNGVNAYRLTFAANGAYTREKV